MKEKWVKVIGFDEYEVSDIGRPDKPNTRWIEFQKWSKLLARGA